MIHRMTAEKIKDTAKLKKSCHSAWRATGWKDNAFKIIV